MSQETIKISMQKKASTGHLVRWSSQCPYCFTDSFPFT